MEQWQDFKSRFEPLNLQYAQQMADDSPAKRAQAITGSMANTQSTMAAGNAALTKQATGAGINPNSGRFMGLKSNYAGEMGGAAGTGAVGANDAVEGRKWAGVTKAMRMGRGQASQSVAGLTSSAYLEAQAQALKERTNDTISANNANMHGNLAGMAVGGAAYGYRQRNQPGGVQAYVPHRTDGLH